MKFTVHNIEGEPLFTAEIDAKKGAPVGIKLALAAEWAFHNGVDLTGADLRGAVFAGADLTGMVAHAVDFRDADFSGANITEVDFSRSNTSGANFEGAVVDPQEETP